MSTSSTTTTTTVIVMGVSGSGKTTVAQGISDAKGWTYAEGDEFHSEANVAKMASGHPLTDEDRWPWLQSIADWIAVREEAGESVVVTCSALKRVYRDLLAEDNPSVVFCELKVPDEVLEERLAHREGHYMPASLLRSQLDTLEDLHPDERGFRVRVEGGPDHVLNEVLAHL